MTEDRTSTHDNGATAVALAAVADLVRSGRADVYDAATLDGTETRCRIRVDTLAGHLQSILPAMTDVTAVEWRGETGWLYRDHTGYLLTWKITVQELYGTAAAAAGECDRPATIRIEGYRPQTADDPVGSLDGTAYTCDQHVDAGVALMKERGLNPWRCPGPMTGPPLQCGRAVDYTRTAEPGQWVTVEPRPVQVGSADCALPRRPRGVARVPEHAGEPMMTRAAAQVLTTAAAAAHDEQLVDEPAGDPLPYRRVPVIVVRAIAYVSGAGANSRTEAINALDGWDLRPDMSDEDIAEVINAFPGDPEVLRSA